MYPTDKQLALLKQCHDLYGVKNVRMTGPTGRDPNVYVKCRGDRGIYRMIYAPNGDILSSWVETQLTAWEEPTRKARNAIDN